MFDAIAAFPKKSGHKSRMIFPSEKEGFITTEHRQQEGIEPKMTDHKLRSGVNRQWGITPKGHKTRVGRMRGQR